MVQIRLKLRLSLVSPVNGLYVSDITKVEHSLKSSFSSHFDCLSNVLNAFIYVYGITNISE